jgi:hypothetical protein
MPSQPTDPIDEAVELATRRTAAAHRRFVAVPPVVPEALERATEVERRADDVVVLAGDAAERTRSTASRAKEAAQDDAQRERPE